MISYKPIPIPIPIIGIGIGYIGLAYYRSNQGGIFPGNLGTGFPGNPWASGEIFGRSHAFLMPYTSERN
jgi:hypothetical protein